MTSIQRLELVDTRRAYNITCELYKYQVLIQDNELANMFLSYNSKHGILKTCRFNNGLASSSTLAQHWGNIGSTLCKKEKIRINVLFGIREYMYVNGDLGVIFTHLHHSSSQTDIYSDISVVCSPSLTPWCWWFITNI